MADIDILLENPVRFLPPNGSDAEWPEVKDWTNEDWAHWLREHNKYAFLRQWTEQAIRQYIDVDRWKYGLSFQRPGDEKPWWFYIPTPIAVPFHASKVPNILFGGAAGGSKSHSARYDAYRHCFGVKSFKALIMRRTFAELERNHLEKAKSECIRVYNFFGKEVMRYVSDPPTITFFAHEEGFESKIFFGHCQNPGDEEKYLGDDYQAFYPDEAATFLRTQITGVQGRLRSENRQIIPRLGATSNPGGGHTLWLKDEYITKDVVKLREKNPRYKPEDYQFIQAMLYDNPYYMDPDGTYTRYEDRLFAYDAERRVQLLLGDWSSLAGQFFPEFTESRHVKELSIPEGSRIERWIDWGYTPHYGMCLWVAIFPNGRAYVFAEWQFNGERTRHLMVASEVAREILRYTKEDIFAITRIRRITKSVADPSMWNADGHGGEDYAETFSKNGVPLTKADNSRVLGWGRLRHWFRLAPDGMPWLMIHPGCVTTVRTIPALIRDKHDPDDIDTDGEDHPADCLRYGVMARPAPKRTMESPRIITPGSPLSVIASLYNTPTRSLGLVS